MTLVQGKGEKLDEQAGQSSTAASLSVGHRARQVPALCTLHGAPHQGVGSAFTSHGVQWLSGVGCQATAILAGACAAASQLSAASAAFSDCTHGKPLREAVTSPNLPCDHCTLQCCHGIYIDCHKSATSAHAGILCHVHGIRQNIYLLLYEQSQHWQAAQARTSASSAARQLGSQACACRSSSVTSGPPRAPAESASHRALPHTPPPAASAQFSFSRAAMAALMTVCWSREKTTMKMLDALRAAQAADAHMAEQPYLHARANALLAWVLCSPSHACQQRAWQRMNTTACQRCGATKGNIQFL